MYDQTLYQGRKYFCHYCSQDFSTEEILKYHMANKGLQCLIKATMLNSKIMRRLKSPLMIYADYESILVVENNGTQNPKSLILTNIKKHIACSYGYKLVCVDDKFKESCRTYLGKDGV